MSGVIRLSNFSFGKRFKIGGTINVVVLQEQLKIAIFDDSDSFRVPVGPEHPSYSSYGDFLFDRVMLAGNKHIYDSTKTYESNYLRQKQPTDFQLIFDQHPALGKYIVVFQDYLYEIVILEPDLALSLKNPPLTTLEMVGSILEDSESKGFNSKMVLDAINHHSGTD